MVETRDNQISRPKVPRCDGCFAVSNLLPGYTPEDLLKANTQNYNHHLNLPTAEDLRRHLVQQYESHKPSMLRNVDATIDWYKTWHDTERRRRMFHRNQQRMEADSRADAEAGNEPPKGLWMMRRCPKFSECGQIMVWKGGWWMCYEHGDMEQAPYNPPEPVERPVVNKEVPGFSSVGKIIQEKLNFLDQ